MVASSGVYRLIVAHDDSARTTPVVGHQVDAVAIVHETIAADEHPGAERAGSCRAPQVGGAVEVVSKEVDTVAIPDIDVAAHADITGHPLGGKIGFDCDPVRIAAGDREAVLSGPEIPAVAQNQPRRCVFQRRAARVDRREFGTRSGIYMHALVDTENAAGTIPRRRNGLGPLIART